MTRGSDATHLIVMASDDRVVAEPGALPDEADDRAAPVVAGQPPVAANALDPGRHELADRCGIDRGQHRGGRVLEAPQERGDIVHAHPATPVDRYEPLAVHDDVPLLPGLDRTCQLLDVAIVIAQEVAPREVVVPVGQGRVEAHRRLESSHPEPWALGAKPTGSHGVAGRRVGWWQTERGMRHRAT